MVMYDWSLRDDDRCVDVRSPPFGEINPIGCLTPDRSLAHARLMLGRSTLRPRRSSFDGRGVNPKQIIETNHLEDFGDAFIHGAQHHITATRLRLTACA